MDHKSNNSCSFNEITFGAKRFQQSIESHKEILEKFYVGFEQASLISDFGCSMSELRICSDF